MPPVHRPTSLTIPIKTPPLWCAIRPPTPRRATYPSISMIAGLEDDAPPVPPLSYWDPDTPSPFASITSPSSPKSPMNPFLIPPNQFAMNPHPLFPKAKPLLPASPLSIFDQTVSPTALTPLFSRTPTVKSAKKTLLLPASPLSPRFMDPRTPPPCPETQTRNASVYDVVVNMAERKGSVASMVRMRETMRLEFYQFLFLKKQNGMDRRAGSEEKTGERSGWEIKGLWKRLFGKEKKLDKEKMHSVGKGHVKVPKLKSLVSRGWCIRHVPGV